MKIITKAIIAFAAVLSGITPVLAVTHEGKRPITVFTDGTRPCTFFRLEGVTQADPAQPDEWFAISRSHPAYAENVAVLLTAKVSKLLINVSTNGTNQCGFAGVDNVTLP